MPRDPAAGEGGTSPSTLSDRSWREWRDGMATSRRASRRRRHRCEARPHSRKFVLGHLTLQRAASGGKVGKQRAEAAATAALRMRGSAERDTSVDLERSLAARGAYRGIVCQAATTRRTVPRGPRQHREAARRVVGIAPLKGDLVHRTRRGVPNSTGPPLGCRCLEPTRSAISTCRADALSGGAAADVRCEEQNRRQRTALGSGGEKLRSVQPRTAGRASAAAPNTELCSGDRTQHAHGAVSLDDDGKVKRVADHRAAQRGGEKLARPFASATAALMRSRLARPVATRFRTPCNACPLVVAQRSVVTEMRSNIKETKQRMQLRCSQSSSGFDNAAVSGVSEGTFTYPRDVGRPVLGGIPVETHDESHSWGPCRHRSPRFSG